MERKGFVFNVQKFSVHDGPGIRTTVFLKGCPLSCKWCHNPESVSPGPSLAFYSHRCTGCGRCAKACPVGAAGEKGGFAQRSLCAGCGACVQACPFGARELFGKPMTVAEALAVVLEDEIFYRTSGGGMTISGGEPFFQPEWTLELLAEARKKNIHTAVETNLFTETGYLERALEVTDLFYCDLKFIDEAKHIEYCGVSNRRILHNARFVSERARDVIFRTPLIKGVNDTELEALADFLASLPVRRRIELLKYHDIGASKYEALGMEYQLPDAGPCQMDEARERLRALGAEVI